MSDVAFQVGTGQSKLLRDKGDATVAEEIFALTGVAHAAATFVAVGGTYAPGDLVANSTTAGSVVFQTLALARNAAGQFVLQALRATKSTTGTGVSIRAHLFRAAPVVSTTGDNGVLATVLAGRAAGWLGSIDITFDQIFNDGACGIGVPNVGPAIFAKLTAGLSTVYLVVEARSTAIGVGEVLTFESVSLD